MVTSVLPLTTIDDITAQAALDVAALSSQLIALTGGVAHGAVFGNGETLTPGIYDVGEAANIQGILTLDAEGDSSALFVIRISGALSSVAASQILLTNGANAANVFWRSTGAVGLGANSTFIGTAVAVTSAASLAAASSMTGRLLSTTGAVSIDSSISLSIPEISLLGPFRLGVLSTFAMFSSVGAVANTGTSNIVGDIGSNEGAISGFGAPTVLDGNVYTVGDAGDTPNTKELRQRRKLDLAALKRQGNVLNSDGTVYSAPLGSAQFNGSNQYLTVPANPALALGTGDFTVETWVYLSSAPGEYAVIDCEGTGQFGFLINSTDIIAFASVAESYSFTSAVSASEWHHIAFCRVGNTLTCYLDGVSVGTPATTAYNFTSPNAFTIGRNPGANSQYLNGYLSNLRIVKGQALYTNNFTPSTSTLTAVVGTQLLLLNGATGFVDGSSNQFTITNGGGVTLSTTAPTLTVSTPFYRARATYDITQLPTRYSDNFIINNPNAGGLLQGRPWIETISTFTFYEAFGTTAAISTTQYVSGNKIYAESSTYDVPSYQPARVIVNDIQVVNTELRGHTLLVLAPNGNVVTLATQYDTWDTVGSPGARAALASALGAVASGNIVVLVSYDASGLNAGIRSAINTGYGSTNTNTWESGRQSHIFIGVKI